MQPLSSHASSHPPYDVALPHGTQVSGGGGGGVGRAARAECRAGQRHARRTKGQLRGRVGLAAPSVLVLQPTMPEAPVLEPSTPLAFEYLRVSAHQPAFSITTSTNTSIHGQHQRGSAKLTRQTRCLVETEGHTQAHTTQTDIHTHPHVHPHTARGGADRRTVPRGPAPSSASGMSS